MCFTDYRYFNRKIAILIKTEIFISINLINMKYILSSLFAINIVISISSISSSIVLINNNDSYITSSQFGLYLCVAFISFLLSSLYLTLRYNCNKSEQILNNIACLASFFVTVLWTAASICITLLTYNCFNIKIKSDQNICTSAMFNITFGFIEVCLWLSILWITMKRLIDSYNNYPALEAQASDEISRHEFR